MEVFLYPNTLKDQHLLVTRRAAKILRKAGVGLLAPLGCEEALSQTETRFLPDAQAFSEADAVLTVGGDGTLLRAAACCVAAGKPVLGVNLGRTGFLATCEVEEMPEKLARLAAGDFHCTDRGLLCAQAPEHGWRQMALNDVSIFGTSRLHPMDFSVFCDDVRVSRFRGDGLIVATPTGSTAYSFSAGGPILDAEANVFVLSPVCAHGGRTSPIVFSSARKLRIVAEMDNRTDVTASADSQPPCVLPPGACITISAAPQRLKLISFTNGEQFRAVETKLLRR